MPVPMEALKAALEVHGDPVSQPTSFNMISTGQQGWVIQCNQRGQPRHCLIDPEKTHNSNNCMLFLLPEANHKLCLEYYCTAESCKHKARVVLGCFELNQWCQWGFVQRGSEVPDNDNMVVDAPPTEGVAHDPMATEEEAEEETLLSLINSGPKEENTYAHVKARFEHHFFMVRYPISVAQVPESKGSMPNLLTFEKTRNYCVGLQYWEEDVDKHGNRRLKPQSFINQWLKDTKRQEFRKIVVDPTRTCRGDYNLWAGYVAEALPPVSNIEVEGLVELIIRHIREVIANDDEGHTKYVIDWMAHMFQKPWEKTMVAIMLYGKEGCGKDILFDFLRHSVMGLYCTYQTSDPDNDIFGRFASGPVNKVLVQIDEVKALHAHADKLKNLITCDTIRLEKKGADCITVDNFANLIFTSNNESALSVATDARRFVLFQCSPKYKGDTVYFTALKKHLARPDVARAWYQYMMTRDLSTYEDGFQAHRPITEFYREAQKKSISTTNHFLSACVNTLEACGNTLDGDTETNIESIQKTIGARKLYDHYRQFCLQSGLKQDFIKTETSFATDLSHVQGV